MPRNKIQAGGIVIKGMFCHLFKGLLGLVSQVMGRFVRPIGAASDNKTRIFLMSLMLASPSVANAIDGAGPFMIYGRQFVFFTSYAEALADLNSSTTRPCQHYDHTISGINMDGYAPRSSCAFDDYYQDWDTNAAGEVIKCDGTKYTGGHDLTNLIIGLSPAPGTILDLTDHNNDPIRQFIQGCVATDQKKPDPARNVGEPPNACSPGNPINAATGNKFERHVDFLLDGPLAITWARYYNSDPNWHPMRQDLGGRWTHEYQRQVLANTNPSNDPNPTIAYVVRHDGRIFKYAVAGTTWVYPDANNVTDIVGSLSFTNGVNSSQGWTFINEKSEKETYNPYGNLTSIADRNGNSISFTLNSDGQILSIRDHAGALRATLTYSAVGGQLQDITIPDISGPKYSYEYSKLKGKTRLAKVVYPDSDDPANRANNPYRSYLYAEPQYMHDPLLGPQAFPGALTGYVDSGQVRFATFKYDSLGRAWSTEHASGNDKVTLAFRSFDPSTGIGETDTTDAFGHIATFKYQVDHRQARITGVTGSSALCSSRPAEQTYNDRGAPASTTDFNGNRTIYEYLHPTLANYRGLYETCRIEGIPSVASADNADKAYRMVTTAWDPTFRVPLLVTTLEPTDPTMAPPTTCSNTVYFGVNSIPNPAIWRKRKEVESVLVAGASRVAQTRVRSYLGTTQDEAERVTTYTYYTDTTGDLAPLNGLLKRVDGPRTDVDDFTDFQYITAATVNAAHPLIGALWKVQRKVTSTLSLT